MLVVSFDVSPSAGSRRAHNLPRLYGFGFPDRQRAASVEQPHRSGHLCTAGQKDPTKAEQIFLRALHEASRFGANDVRVAATLNKLGLLYQQGKNWPTPKRLSAAACPFFNLCTAITVSTLPMSISTSAVFLNDMGKPSAALPFLQKARYGYEKVSGANSVLAASALCLIGDSQRELKAWVDAESSLKQCARIREANSGILNAEVGDAVNSLANLYRQEGKYSLADPEFRLAEKIRERTLGITSPAFADTLEAHASLLKELGRYPEAEKDAVMAAAIRRNQKKTN